MSRTVEHRWMVPIIRVCVTKDDNSAAGDYRGACAGFAFQSACWGGSCFTFPVKQHRHGHISGVCQRCSCERQVVWPQCVGPSPPGEDVNWVRQIVAVEQIVEKLLRVAAKLQHLLH